MEVKPLLILDISGLLCCKVPLENSHKSKVILRPHVRQFLEACYATYTVGFFSSTTFKNANAILKGLLTTEQESQTLFRWYRDRTQFDPEYPTNRFIKVYDTVKYISDVLNNPLVNMNRLYNYQNTIICDDSLHKVRFNPKANVVLVPKFEIPGGYSESARGRFESTGGNVEDNTLLNMLPVINRAFNLLNVRSTAIQSSNPPDLSDVDQSYTYN